MKKYVYALTALLICIATSMHIFANEYSIMNTTDDEIYVIFKQQGTENSYNVTIPPAATEIIKIPGKGCIEAILYMIKPNDSANRPELKTAKIEPFSHCDNNSTITITTTLDPNELEFNIED